MTSSGNEFQLCMVWKSIALCQFLNLLPSNFTGCSLALFMRQGESSWPTLSLPLIILYTLKVSSLILLLSEVNTTSLFSLSSTQMFPVLLLILISLRWNPSNSAISSLRWGDQFCTQYSRGDCTIYLHNGLLFSFLFLMHPNILFTFLNAVVHLTEVTVMPRALSWVVTVDLEPL